MLISIKTFDGHNINDGTNYRAYGLAWNQLPAALPVLLDMPRADPVDSGAWSVEGRTVPISIRIRNYASRNTLITQLKGWFKRGTQGSLVVTFTDEAVDYQMTVRVVNLVQDPENSLAFTALLQGVDTAWRSVAVETASAWNPTGTGGTKAITVGGDDETRLIVTLTPSVAPGTGYLYQKLYQLPNVPGVNLGFTPWCMTIDHAALVAAGKSQADGDDLRIHVNGVEVNRWFGTLNNAATKIWFNLTINQGYSLTIATSVHASNDIAYLQFKNTPNNVNALAKMPKKGILYHGTEWMSYDGVNPTTRRATITQRGILGTTKQAHSVSDAFVYIQNAITLSYGKPSATNPVTDDALYDNMKPLFLLTSSDNTSWVYDTTTQFRDLLNTGRTGGWAVAQNKQGTVSKLYDITGDAESGNPALGAKIGAYVRGTGWVSDTANLRHIFRRGCGLNTITMTGRMWRNGNPWPEAVVQKSADGVTWVTLWTETKPTTPSSWTNWAAHSAVSLGSGYKFLRMKFEGSVAGANKYAMNECLTATVTFISANLPTGTLGSEVTNYTLELTLSNTDTVGDSLDIINAPILLNKAFLLDGENYSALYDNVNVHDTLRLNDESRSIWIRLKPGAGTLQIAGADIGTLGVALSWYKRRL